MPNISALIDAASVQVIDLATNDYRVNAPVGTITTGLNFSEYRAYQLVAGGAGTSVPFQTTPVTGVYVKNLDTTAIITVQFQVVGGSLISAANAPPLLPGGIFIYWCPQPNPTNTGLTTGLTLISSVGSTAVELCIVA